MLSLLMRGIGLGGSSLINGGVFLEADHDTLQRSPWPPEIRENPSVLDKYYTRAATVLQPNTYPKDLPQPRKTKHLQELSQQLGCERNFYQVPLTTFFQDDRNSMGVSMRANDYSGNECTGMNDGSKNSVAVTYLADAWNWGAEIFCGCEVKFVEPVPDGTGYTVYFSWHESGRNQFTAEFKDQLCWVKAKEFCFLGAGAIGTTEILLRSKARGMQMSPNLGRSLSGNGGHLLFGYNGRSDFNAIAGSRGKHRSGPVVTSIIDNRHLKKGNDSLAGYSIQDGAIPKPFTPFIQSMFMAQMFLQWFSEPRNVTSMGQVAASLKSLILGPYVEGGAIQRTATYLIMSHDSNQATLTLEDDKVKLSSPAAGRSANLSRIRDTLTKALSKWGSNLRFSYFYGRNREEVTVHLLGGANLSRDGTGQEGVTNHFGEVFCGTGNEVYNGLICCDASIVPTSLGINPLATICALAERAVEIVADRSGLVIDFETKNGNLDVNSEPRVSKSQMDGCKGTTPLGWRFTEALDGMFYLQQSQADVMVGQKAGSGLSCAMRLLLTIELERRLEASATPVFTGKCSGTAMCPGLSKATLKVEDGRVDFFAPHADLTDSKVLRYSLVLRSIEGATYRFRGEKFIDSRIAFSVSKTWAATTTVYFEVTSTAGPVGAGILRIHFQNFRRQLRTFRADRGLTLASILAILSFLLLWIWELGRCFFLPRIKSSNPRPKTEIKPVTKKQSPEIVNIIARDGVATKIEIYESVSRSEGNLDDPVSNNAPILFLPGVTGVGAEFNLYALPFLNCNMTDYFTARGHRCYVLTPRWGCDAEVSEKSTVYDCRLDVAAAVDYISRTESARPYVMAHCQGSVAMAMALLDGTILAKDILGVTANSVFMNERFAFMNSLKGRTTLLIQLYELLAGQFFPVSTGKGSGLFQSLLDILLRLYPVSDQRDICSSTACHRCSFGFGLLWNHENLNRQTHDNIHRFFAGTHTKLLKHVVRAGTHGFCQNNDFQDLGARPGNLERLRGLPILLISGTQNEVFNPETTLRDYNLLRETFGEQNYRRFLADGYGHLDPIVGKNADKDVYWKVAEHIKWCSKRARTTIVNGHA